MIREMPIENFHEWFKNKLIVGGYPSRDDKTEKFYMCNDTTPLDAARVVINVSDEFFLQHNLEMMQSKTLWLWFPLGEDKGSMNYSSLFGIMQTLYACEKQDIIVYLHCSAGINRSWTSVAMYYYLRTGQPFNAPNIKLWRNQMDKNIAKGILPSKEEMDNFLDRVAITLLEPENFLGGTFDFCSEPGPFIDDRYDTTS